MNNVTARRPVLLGVLFVVLLAAFWVLFQWVSWARYRFLGRALPQAQAQTACWVRPQSNLAPTPVSEGAASDGVGPGAGSGDDGGEE